MRKLNNILQLGIKELRSLQHDLALVLLILWAFSLGVYSSATSMPESLHNAAIATLLPAIQFSGLIYPVASLEGFGALVGQLYPTSQFLVISRGVFSKALELRDLLGYFVALALTVPLLTLLSASLLRKQEV